MKYLLLLLFSVSAYCQTLTEKWNTYQNRYEFFNSNNQLIGYKKYNTYTRAWEYFEETPVQHYQPQSNINIPLTNQVLAARQARYDTNKRKLQNTYDKLLFNTYKLFPNKTESEIKVLNQVFTDVYVTPTNKQNIDLSQDSVVYNYINYLISSYNEMMADTE